MGMFQNLKSKATAVFVGGSVVLATSAPALAAVSQEIKDELSAAKVDGVAIAGLVLVVIIAIAAFKYIRKAL